MHEIPYASRQRVLSAIDAEEKTRRRHHHSEQCKEKARQAKIPAFGGRPVTKRQAEFLLEYQGLAMRCCSASGRAPRSSSRRGAVILKESESWAFSPIFPPPRRRPLQATSLNQIQGKTKMVSLKKAQSRRCPRSHAARRRILPRGCEGDARPEGPKSRARQVVRRTRITKGRRPPSPRKSSSQTSSRREHGRPRLVRDVAPSRPTRGRRPAPPPDRDGRGDRPATRQGGWPRMTPLDLKACDLAVEAVSPTSSELQKVTRTRKGKSPRSPPSRKRRLRNRSPRAA